MKRVNEILSVNEEKAIQAFEVTHFFIGLSVLKVFPFSLQHTNFLPLRK